MNRSGREGGDCWWCGQATWQWGLPEPAETWLLGPELIVGDQEGVRDDGEDYGGVREAWGDWRLARDGGEADDGASRQCGGTWRCKRRGYGVQQCGDDQGREGTFL
jgi:hypothetical protein